jgi:hypothetical protein
MRTLMQSRLPFLCAALVSERHTCAHVWGWHWRDMHMYIYAPACKMKGAQAVACPLVDFSAAVAQQLRSIRMAAVAGNVQGRDGVSV